MMRQSLILMLAALASALAGCGWVKVDSERRSSVPPPAAPASAISSGAGGRLLTVQPGDTVYGVSARYGVTPRQMIALNDLRPPYEIQVGQRLRLPPPQRLHAVQEGETLSSIARLYAIDPTTLAANNHLQAPYVVRRGETLGVPTQVAAPLIASTDPAPPPESQPRRPAPPASTPSVLRSDLPPPSPPAQQAPAPATQGRYIPPPPQPRVDEPAPPETAAPSPPAAPTAQAPAAVPRRPSELASRATPPSAATVARVDPAPEPPRANRLPDAPAVASPERVGGFLAPVEGPVIAKFGSQADGRKNEGVNIAAPRGTSVRAAADGEVVYAGDALQGYGNLVLVRHSDDWVTAYAHLDSILAKRGTQVVRGQTIGAVGTSGGVSVPQLHFEMRRNNRSVDPTGKLAAQ